MIQFVVKDLTKLTNYGFIHDSERKEYRYYSQRKFGRGALCMQVHEDSHRLVYMSPSRVAVAISCRMYKDGVIDFFDEEPTPTYTMKVSEEEMKTIFKMREEKQNEKLNN